MLGMWFDTTDEVTKGLPAPTAAGLQPGSSSLLDTSSRPTCQCLLLAASGVSLVRGYTSKSLSSGLVLSTDPREGQVNGTVSARGSPSSGSR